MAFSTEITSLTISDGSVVAIPSGAVVVVVGPNNVGKSRLLRDVYRHLALSYPNSQWPPVQVVTAVTTQTNGSLADLTDWLHRNSTVDNNYGQIKYSRMRDSLFESSFRDWSSDQPITAFGSLVVSYLGPGQSQSMVEPAAAFAAHRDAPTHALDHAYLDPTLEAQISDLARQAFGTGLVVDRFAGAQVLMRIGDAPTAPVLSVEYLEDLRGLPLLNEQGDGVKSHLSLLLHMLSMRYFIRLVDEPEAFLHPPQAHLLGRSLGSHKPSDSQLLLCTHDANIRLLAVSCG